jgi:hypothetical protein
VSVFSPESLPKDLKMAEARRAARIVLEGWEAILQCGVLQRGLHLAVLTQLLADEKLGPRIRLRAIELFVRAQAAALGAMGDLACVREQMVDLLGVGKREKPQPSLVINIGLPKVVREEPRSPASPVVMDIAPDPPGPSALPAPGQGDSSRTGSAGPGAHGRNGKVHPGEATPSEG